MIRLKKADFTDCEEIHRMQVEAFTELLEKYRDYDTSPACETLDIIRYKIQNSDYYFITNNTEKVGVIRIINRDDTCRISPMFILPKYQNKGYAQTALIAAEKLYPHIKHGVLDTIKQENKLFHLYTKVGYKPNGREENIKDGMTIIFLEKRATPAGDT